MTSPQGRDRITAEDRKPPSDGSVFPAYLVRLTARRDRWALRIRGRWVLLRAPTAAKRHTRRTDPLLHFATVPRTVGA
jgi:hypothetical protein